MSANQPRPMPSADPFSDPRNVEGQKTMSQIRALFRKSYLVQKRQYKTNICQLLFPLAMIFMLWGLQLFVNNVVRDQYGEFTPSLEHPPLIPPYLMFWDSDPCQPVGPSPRTSPSLARYLITDSGSGLLGATDILDKFTLPTIGGLFNGIYAIGAKKSYDRGSQPATKCTSNPVVATKLNFEVATNMDAVDSRLFKGWGKNDSFLGGLSIVEASSTKFHYNVIVNKSFTDLYDMPALTGSISNAVYRTLVSYNGSIAPATQLQLTGTKSFPMKKTKIEFDLISLIGPSIYIYLFSMLLPVFMHNLVSEKESKIRELMEMMGLKRNVYFIVTYVFNYILYIVAVAFLIAVACLLGFRYFLVNAFGAYVILFFIWGHVLCASAFLLSMFFSKSKTATVVGYLIVFGLGLIASSLIRNFFQSSTTPASTLFLLQLVPNFALFRALDILRDGVSFGSQGLSMSELSDPDVKLSSVYIYLTCEWIVILALVYLFESYGGPMHLMKSLYLPLRHPRRSRTKLLSMAGSVAVSVLSEEVQDGDDVIAQAEAAADENVPVAVRIRDLRKVYKGYGSLPDKVAVKGLSMVIRSGECLGFLGSNGAGKTTTISMLCGYVEPTSGTAVMFGKDINEEMTAIHTIMGICPQENVIWGELSGGEHLEFFGRLKGLKDQELEQAIVDGLREVELLNVRDKFAMQYSGGMKRRLCVAIAFIGRPSIVLLDEPTTGLDPAARRNLWSVICRYKKQCALMLTTHSMEEAENLCDRVGIFERGSLRCIGTSSDLKQRFEQGYKLTLTTNMKHESEIDMFVHRLNLEAVLLNKLGGVITYEIPRASTQLSVVFREVQAQKQQLGIIDWCIANTTLEEVFVRIATGKYKAYKAKSNDDSPYQGILQ